MAAAIAALTEPLPLADRYEANDDAGSRAYKLSGSNRQIKADGRLLGRPGRRLRDPAEEGPARLCGADGADSDSADLSLALWLPRARSIANVSSLRFRARISARPAAREYFSHRAVEGGDVLRAGANVQPRRHPLPPGRRQGLSAPKRLRVPPRLRGPLAVRCPAGRRTFSSPPGSRALQSRSASRRGCPAQGLAEHTALSFGGEHRDSDVVLRLHGSRRPRASAPLRRARQRRATPTNVEDGLVALGRGLGSGSPCSRSESR